jgi:hypothetical protein
VFGNSINARPTCASLVFFGIFINCCPCRVENKHALYVVSRYCGIFQLNATIKRGSTVRKNVAYRHEKQNISRYISGCVLYWCILNYCNIWYYQPFCQYAQNATATEDLISRQRSIISRFPSALVHKWLKLPWKPRATLCVVWQTWLASSGIVTSHIWSMRTAGRLVYCCSTYLTSPSHQGTFSAWQLICLGTMCCGLTRGKKRKCENHGGTPLGCSTRYIN